MLQEEKKSVVSKINNAIDTAFEPIKNRMSHPILGSYIITWCLLNWKFITFMIFSSKTFDKRLEEFNKLYYDEWYWNVAIYYILPLAISLIYPFLLPLTDLFLDKKTYILFYKKKNELDKEKRKDILSHRKDLAGIEFDLEQARLGKRDLEELRMEMQKIIEESEIKTQRIDNLQKDVLRLNNENGDLVTRYQTQIEEKNKINTELQEKLNKYENLLTEAEIQINGLKAHENREKILQSNLENYKRILDNKEKELEKEKTINKKLGEDNSALSLAIKKMKTNEPRYFGYNSNEK